VVGGRGGVRPSAGASAHAPAAVVNVSLTGGVGSPHPWEARGNQTKDRTVGSASTAIYGKDSDAGCGSGYPGKHSSLSRSC
jgi:hypothetical protein